MDKKFEKMHHILFLYILTVARLLYPELQGCDNTYSGKVIVKADRTDFDGKNDSSDLENLAKLNTN